MGVDFGGFYIGVSHELLHHADVNPVFQQVRGKRMSEDMATDPFGDSGSLHGSFDRFLQIRFQNVMAAEFIAAGIFAEFFLLEKVAYEKSSGLTASFVV